MGLAFAFFPVPVVPSLYHRHAGRVRLFRPSSSLLDQRSGGVRERVGLGYRVWGGSE